MRLEASFLKTGMLLGKPEKTREEPEFGFLLRNLAPRGMKSRFLSLFLDGSFSGLEADPGMRAVTERFVPRRAASAESDSLFAADVVLVAVDVSDLKLAQVAGHDIGTVRFDQDIDGHGGSFGER
jgi:hypothetical protein